MSAASAFMTTTFFVPSRNAEGVLQAEKDFNKPKHSDELDVPNLQVIKLMQSFHSKEYVTERFAWRHYYWWVWDRDCLQVPRSQIGLATPFSCVPCLHLLSLLHPGSSLTRVLSTCVSTWACLRMSCLPP